MTRIKLAGAALNQTPLDWDNNLNNIRKAILLAQAESVSILCLPELCITGYGCEDLFLSRWLPAKALGYIGEIADWCENITVCVGLPMWHNNVLYNCTCLIHNKKIMGFVPKQRLANNGVHYEPRWFKGWPPGELEQVEYQGHIYPFGDKIYELYRIQIGFEICEDAWSGDLRPACHLYEQGVQLVLNPSASHFAFYKSAFRENLVVESSRQFECVYVYSNLLGNESGRMIFDGEVFIAQKGRLLKQNKRLSYHQVNLSTTTVDFANPSNSVIEDDKHYEELNEEFTAAISLSLFDYLRKSRNHGFVLSLSGGADSTICAVLVSEMVRRGIAELGTEGFLAKAGLQEHVMVNETMDEDQVRKLILKQVLICVYQATKNSSVETLESARCLSQQLGATFYNWNIDQEVSSYIGKIEQALERSLSWVQDDTALQNIQARTRAPGVWMLANIKNALLISTSNRSEGDLGYTTMDGDTCGSIAPIAAIDKQFILLWLKWAETELAYPALAKVNQLQPSAELRPLELHQTDEADLMPYNIIVAIEKLAIKDHLGPLEVFNNLKTAELSSNKNLAGYIIKFYRLWARNQWKRERIAPSFHLDEFNIDPKTWCRFPILSGGFEQDLVELKNIVNL